MYALPVLWMTSCLHMGRVEDVDTVAMSGVTRPLRRRVQANAPAASYRLRRVSGDGGRRD